LTEKTKAKRHWRTVQLLSCAGGQLGVVNIHCPSGAKRVKVNAAIHNHSCTKAIKAQTFQCAARLASDGFAFSFVCGGHLAEKVHWVQAELAVVPGWGCDKVTIISVQASGCIVARGFSGVHKMQSGMGEDSFPGGNQVSVGRLFAVPTVKVAADTSLDIPSGHRRSSCDASGKAAMATLEGRLAINSDAQDATEEPDEEPIDVLSESGRPMRERVRKAKAAPEVPQDIDAPALDESDGDDGMPPLMYSSEEEKVGEADHAGKAADLGDTRVLKMLYAGHVAETNHKETQTRKAGCSSTIVPQLFPDG
jgi:hypothetical protein